MVVIDGVSPSHFTRLVSVSREEIVVVASKLILKA